MTLHNKTPDQLVPGDIIVPRRGRYVGIHCVVESVSRGEFSIYRVTVVPTAPVRDEFGVDYTERVRVVPKGSA